MITVHIGPNTYNVASEWSEVTLKNYAEIIRLNSVKQESAFIKGVEIISALLIEGDSSAFFDDMFNNLYEHQIEEIANHVKFSADNLNKHISKKPIKAIEIVDDNGNKWGIVEEFLGLKGAERVVLELELQQDNKQYDALELTFGILARRKDADGNLMKFNKDDFKYILSNLTSKVAVTEVFQHISFFLNSGKTNTSSNTQTFSIQTSQTKKSKASPKKKSSK